LSRSGSPRRRLTSRRRRIFSPQSFFGAGPFSHFGPEPQLSFSSSRPGRFWKPVPQRGLPWQNGFYDGPDGPAHEAADAIAFWHKLAGFYVQDQWRVLPNLTLSFGVRYDLDFLPSSSDLRILGKMNQTNLGNVQPRLESLWFIATKRRSAHQLRRIHRIVGIQQLDQRLARCVRLYKHESADSA